MSLYSALRLGPVDSGLAGMVSSGALRIVEIWCVMAGEACCGLVSTGWSVCGVLMHGVESQGMAGLASRVWFGQVKES